jgi:hypothetical protein
VAMLLARELKSQQSEASWALATNLWWYAGVRAVTCGDTVGVLEVFRSLRDSRGPVAGAPRHRLDQTCFHIAATAPWKNYFTTSTVWEQYVLMAGDNASSAVWGIGTLCVGGAALLAGHLSLASRVARYVTTLVPPGTDLAATFVTDQLVVWARDLSLAHGGYLGPEAGVTLRRFVAFAEGLIALNDFGSLPISGN